MPGMQQMRTSGALFVSPDWNVQMVEDGGLDELKSYHADVYRGGEMVCRIALTGSFQSPSVACEAVCKRLRTWLTDYEQRPCTGDSGFQIL